MRFRGVSTPSWAFPLIFLTSCMPITATRRYSAPADESYTLEADLQSLLHDTTLSQDRELSETLSWFRKLPSESNCVQLAAMKLMTECKLLDNPSDFAQAHREWYLDDVKAEYAVKLAVCEIVGAQPDHPYPPQHCTVFYPTVEACIKRSWAPWTQSEPQPSSRPPCYPDASEKNRHQCLKILRNSPQYWTSYSNARFHAVRMCQLSRHAIEREKTIQLHKNLTHVTFRLQSSVRNMEREVRAIQDELKDSFDDLRRSREEMKQFVQKAREKAQVEREQVKREMQSVQVEIGLTRDIILANITAYNDEFNAHMNAAMTKAVEAVKAGSTNFVTSIAADLEKFHQRLRVERSELSATMGTELQQHHEKALLAIQIQHGAMIESFSIVQGELDSANYKVNNLNDKVDVLENKTTSSMAKVEVLHRRLDRLGVRFNSIERVFATLDAVFSFVKVWSVLVLIVLGLPFIVAVGKAIPVRKVAWMTLGCLGLIGIVHVNDYNPFENFQVPRSHLAIEPPLCLLEYIKNPSVDIVVVSAAACFFLIAFLSKINSYDRHVESIAAIPRTLFSWFRRSRQEDDEANTVYLPNTIASTSNAYIPSSVVSSPAPQLPSDHTFTRSNTIVFPMVPFSDEQAQYHQSSPVTPRNNRCSSHPSTSPEDTDQLNQFKTF